MVTGESAFPLHEAVGAVHLHSNFSDGSLPIEEIAAIASRKKINFLLFSDHNTLEPRRLGLEGWKEDVLVLIGCEINDADDRNHYLAFLIDREIDPKMSAEEYVAHIWSMGGFGIIAHPAEKRNFSDAYPPYPWTAWNAKGFDGIEIWNQLSEWMEGLTRLNMLWRIWHPLRSIRFPVWETLQRWDQLNRERRITGIGGIDVHAFPFRIGFISIEIYPYKVQFRSIRTHVLTSRPLINERGEKLPWREAESVVFEALKQGRCFVVNYSVGDGRGFRFWGEQNNRVYQMGDRWCSKGTITFRAVTPLTGKIHLLRDGKRVCRAKGKELVCSGDQPGVYRVEVFRKNRGWIYSNPMVWMQ